MIRSVLGAIRRVIVWLLIAAWQITESVAIWTRRKNKGK